jgi:methionyl-tRNA synthetase
VFARVDLLNREVTESKPWELLRTTNDPKLERILGRWLNELATIAHLLEPLLPNTSQRILEAIAGNLAAPLFPRVGG